MFEIDEDNLPVVRTHSALLILDLQNDFDPVTGLLPIKNPPGYTEKIISILPYFRAAGHIAWVRSVFVDSRPVNSSTEESEVVLTDKSLQPENETRAPRSSSQFNHAGKAVRRRVSSSDDGDADASSDDDKTNNGISETFLTIAPGQKPQLVLPASPGSELCQAVNHGCVDSAKDMFIQKSHYSAFKDGSLVQTLRSKFVTELYLCGSLTNISVFATALDAARHGYAITILDDCLGYRSRRRHDMALKHMKDCTGCETMKSVDLIKDLKQRAKYRDFTSKRHARPAHHNTNIESLMSNLKINATSSSAPESSGTAAVANMERHKSPDRVTPNEEQISTIYHPKVNENPPERVRSKTKVRRRPSKHGLKKTKGAAESTGNLSNEGSGPSQPLPAKSIESLSNKISDMKLASESARELATTSERPGTTGFVENVSMDPAAEIMHKDSETKHTSETKIVNDDKLIAKEQSSICEGDTMIIEDLMSEELSEEIFARVRDEVRWQKMSHQGGDVPRLICVQGELGKDGSKPIYRHPADESPPLLPFSPSVSIIRAEVEARLGHPVNHVLVQFYRDGKDYISEHSDKTLDIVHKTFIANVSLGAQRTMIFRTKKPLKNAASTEQENAQPRQSCRAPLPHNSMCKMGLMTNMRWLHAIRQDKRMESERSPAELAYDGGRISLTFRQIGTFLDKDEVHIWGQGATGKARNQASMIINGETPEAEQMIRAFGKENHSSDFDWNEVYGSGFDVLHIFNNPKLFLSCDAVADLRVKLMLAEYQILWTEGNLSPSFGWKDGSSAANAPAVPSILPIKYVDNDIHRSATTGDLAVMLYLDAVYGVPSRKSQSTSQASVARQFTRFQECNKLLQLWRAEPFSIKPFRKELNIWEMRAQESNFAAGDSISLADYALWPILHEISKEWINDSNVYNLTLYYTRLLERDVFRTVVGHAIETPDGKAVDVEARGQ